jgi:L-lactate dehydrogenase complex protein LldE
MKIALFVPCYVNQFYPQVAIATYKLLQRQGFDVQYPPGQTCCGQPLANSGFEIHTKEAKTHFEKMFKSFDLVVSPSASCVLYVKQHHDYLGLIMELSEFLLAHGDKSKFSSHFPKKVGVLQSCHGLRGLGLGKPSELVMEKQSTVMELMSEVKGLELIQLNRSDDCCGFGGTFSIKEPDLSVKMGNDRLRDFIGNKTEVITGTDVSCLMHLDGIIRKRKLPLEVMHFSEILCQP